MNWEQRFREMYEGIEDDPDYLAAERAQEIIEVICQRMRELGLSQTELARRIGTSQAYVAKVLNHHPNMTLRSMVMLAEGLGLRLASMRFIDRQTRRVYQARSHYQGSTAVYLPRIESVLPGSAPAACLFEVAPAFQDAQEQVYERLPDAA